MKAFNYITLTFLLLSFTGCYDDSELQKDVADLQKRVSSLEVLCSQMNNNIIGMQTIINVLNNNDYITAVTPIKNGDEEIGYTITFLKSAPITIYHGKNGSNGQNGKDGTTPIVGLREDSDGNWYWTIGNEWILDDKGDKVRANGIPGENGEDGIPGITPQLTITDGYWYISLDNCVTWTKLGKATGEDGMDGDSMFLSVTYDDKYAYFTLLNGTVLTVPQSTNIPKLQFSLDKETDFHLTGGESIVLNYTITSPTGAHTTLTSYENNDWKVVIQETSATMGFITITAPNPVQSGKVMLILSDDFGNVFIKTLEIIGDDNVIKIAKTEYTIDEYGGYIDVAVDANLGFIVQILDGGNEWISTETTGATTRFTVLSNADYSSRSARIRFKGNDGETYSDITITQLQNNAIVVESNQVNITENAQTYNLIIRSNIDCSILIPSGISWIKNTTTKALMEKSFTLNISENEDYAPRSAVVVVSDSRGMIKQSITFTQSGYTPVYVSIPDATFFSLLVEEYDINSDGKIDQKEAAQITDLDCSGKNITSLSGIEYFTNLTSLDCSRTQIVDLDISSNTALTSVFCQYNEAMTSLKLPPVSSIPSRAFVSCTSLRELDLPNTISSIGDDAFQNCSGMESLIVRSDIDATYRSAFSGSTFSDVSIIDLATTVTQSMFAGSSYIKNVVIGQNVTTLDSGAFSTCLNLQKVTFEKYSRLRTIESTCFASCTNLSLLDMSNCTEVSSMYCHGYLGSIFRDHSSPLSIYLGTRVPPSLDYKIYEYDHNSHIYFHVNLHVPSDCIDAYMNNSKWYNSSYVTIYDL